MTAPAHMLTNVRQNETPDSLEARGRPQHLRTCSPGGQAGIGSSCKQQGQKREERAHFQQPCHTSENQDEQQGISSSQALPVGVTLHTSPTCPACAFHQTGGLPGLGGPDPRAQSGQVQAPWWSSPGCCRKPSWSVNHSKLLALPGHARGVSLIAGLLGCSGVQATF